MSLSLYKSILLVATILLGFVVSTGSAAAQTNIPVDGVDLQGFAWSAYDVDPRPGTALAGLGWISMNCDMVGSSEPGSCAAAGNYKVSLESDGNLTGYAWSSTVGWISFDPVGPYPSGPGTIATTALAVSGDYNNTLTYGGWARVCAATPDPDTCSGVGANERAGGWDGWISLGGRANDGSNYALAINGPDGSAPTSFGWGGPIVSGWIAFSEITYIPPAPTPASAITITLDCPDGQVSRDSNQNCDYKIQTNPPIETECVIEPSTSERDQSFTLAPTIGIFTGSVTVTPFGFTTYKATCTDTSDPDNSTTVTDTIDVLPLATLDDLYYVTGGVTFATGTLSTSGIYDYVDISMRVGGTPAGATGIGYSVRLGPTDDNVTETGTFGGNGGNPVTINVRLNNVRYNAAVPYRLAIDTSNAIVESNEENNIRAGVYDLSPIAPTIGIGVNDVVRSGTPAELELSVSTTLEATCTIFAPGLTGEVVVVAAGSVDATISRTTAPLFNSTTVLVECSVDPDLPPYQQTKVIEVTPSLQEV